MSKHTLKRRSKHASKYTYNRNAPDQEFDCWVASKIFFKGAALSHWYKSYINYRNSLSNLITTLVLVTKENRERASPCNIVNLGTIEYFLLFFNFNV